MAHEAQIAAEKAVVQITSLLEAAQRDLDTQTHLHAKAESEAQKKIVAAQIEAQQAKTACDEAQQETKAVRSQMASELEEQHEIQSLAEMMCQQSKKEVS